MTRDSLFLSESVDRTVSVGTQGVGSAHSIALPGMS